MTIDEKIAYAVDLLLKLRKEDGTEHRKSREEEIELARWMYVDDPDAMGEKALDEWIEFLKGELAKTPEQREAERLAESEEMAEREAEMDYIMRMNSRYERDEWDGRWSDLARSVGATVEAWR